MAIGLFDNENGTSKTRPAAALHVATVAQAVSTAHRRAPTRNGFLILSSPCSAGGLRYGSARSGSQPPRSNPLVQRRQSYPKLDETCDRVRPLVVAMRTGSRRNSSVYLGVNFRPIDRKQFSKETGTKLGQDQCFKRDNAAQPYQQQKPPSTRRSTPVQ